MKKIDKIRKKIDKNCGKVSIYINETNFDKNTKIKIKLFFTNKRNTPHVLSRICNKRKAN